MSKINNEVIIETSRPCCVSCYYTLKQCDLLYGRGKSNRIFKTALPSDCSRLDAEKIVEALHNEVQWRFTLSEKKIHERYELALTSSPTYSSDDHSDSEVENGDVGDITGNVVGGNLAQMLQSAKLAKLKRREMKVAELSLDKQL